MIITITGASGVGKTSILSALTANLPEGANVKIFHFDDIGMPNWDEVEDTKQWQEDTTVAWIDRLVEVARTEKVHILFEGSTEPRFFVQGFAKNDFQDYKILLFDCTPETMQARLIHRGQPELFQPDMVNWLNFLREDAVKRNIDIIRTDQLTMDEIGRQLLSELK